MIQNSELLSRYKQLRQVGLQVNNALVKSIPRDVLHEGGKKLDMLRRGVFVFETEDETSVLMDFCLHDVRRNGMNVVERYLAETPPSAGSDEMVIVQAKQTAWYSIFEVESVERGVGIRVRDLLRDETRLVVDISFSETAIPGVILATRLMAPDGIIMTTGAGLPLGVLSPSDRNELKESLQNAFPGVRSGQMSTEESSKLTASIIRAALKRGAAETVTYADPGSPISTRRAAMSHAPATGAGRNDPCPCGSGKKFKKCCGA
jgi:hypothetical protein